MIDSIMLPFVGIMFAVLSFFLRELHREFLLQKQDMVLLKTSIRACEIEIKALHRLVDKRFEDWMRRV